MRARPHQAAMHCAAPADGCPSHVLKTWGIAVAGAPASCSLRLGLTGRAPSPLCLQVCPGTVPSPFNPHTLCACGSPPFHAQRQQAEASHKPSRPEARRWPKDQCHAALRKDYLAGHPFLST